MYLIPLMLLALGLGGVQKGTCFPSRTQNYLKSLRGDYSSYIDSASRKLNDIWYDGQDQERKTEVEVLTAFNNLRPVAELDCDERIDSQLERMEEVLKEATSATSASSMTPKEIAQVKKLVSRMTKNYYKICLEQQTRRIKTWPDIFDSSMAALNRMEVFKKFAKFSLKSKPLESFKAQAERVLTKPEYLEYLKTISKKLDDTAPKSPDKGPFSDSCGYLEYAHDGKLDYGIAYLEGAASLGLDLGVDHPRFQYYRNYALCIVSRNYLMKNLHEAQKAN